MVDLVFVGCVLLVVLMGLGMWRRRLVRRCARAVLGLLFALASFLALLALYGSIVLQAAGGGILILPALILGGIAWALGAAFFASRDSERYYALPVDGKIAENLRLSERIERDYREKLARKLAERERPWTSRARREALDREIARLQELLAGIAAMRAAVRRPEAYAEDEA